MTAKVLQFPDHNVSDIPRMLRAMADDIESGDIPNCLNLAWAIDGGGGNISVGLMGAAAEAGPVAYLLLGLARRKIEDGCIVGSES